MQKENTEFDLLVRSMMQDAEEPVSPRVWDAVSAGLDAQVRKPVVLRWRRAAAGIAAAAAIAVGAVLVGTRSNSNLPIHIDTVAEEISSPVQAEVQGITEDRNLLADAGGQTVEPKVSATRREPVRSAEAAVPQQVTALPQPAEEPAAVEEAASAQDPDVLPAEEPQTGSVREALTQETSEPDPFARMEWEDAHAAQASRISISVGGILESNGNPTSAIGPRAMRAAVNEDRDHTVIEQTSRNSTYAIPLSAGLGIRIGLSPRWSIGTGVNWTLLQRTFTGIYREEGKTPLNADIHHTLHYIGVPVHLYYNLMDNRRINLYAFAGGAGEKAVSNKFRVFDNSENLYHKEKVDGFQWSAAAGLGVQFRLTDHLGLYLDPSVRYYFDCGQPKSIRTQQPLTMNFEIGLRMDL